MCVNCGNDCGNTCKVTVVTKQGVQGPQGPPFVPGGNADQYVAGDGSIQDFPNGQNPVPQPPENQFFARTTTRSALNPNSYYNGPDNDGIGATITFNSVGLIKEQLYNAGRIGGANVDIEVGDVILVRFETNKKKHGAYVVSVNSLTEQCVLTRLAGYDETSEINSSQVTVYDGEEAGRIFVQQIENPVIGTDDIIYRVASNTSSIPFLCVKVDNVTDVPLPSFTYIPGTTRPIQPGFGAKIQMNAVGVFPTLNGVTPYLGMRLLVNGESGANQNYQGDYTLTKLGSGSIRAELVRSYSATFNQSKHQFVEFLVNSPSSYFFGKRFTLENTSPILDSSIGTVPLIYIENNSGGANNLQEVSDAGGFDNGSTLKKGSKNNYGFGGGISQVCFADKELQWENGVQYYFPVGQPIVWANSINADTPDTSYDDTKGFAIGSTYNDLVNNKSYKCTDATTGAAVWAEIVDAIDSAPTSGSSNAVSSGGVFTALGTKEDASNKQTDLTASATKFPTVNAVNAGLATKEPTIASGTTAQYWRGDKTWQPFPSMGLTIGTTPIVSGTIGRILFQGTGDIVQQDSTLFWDNTNKRLGIGATPDTSTRLDVRMQGALSTDFGFRVRNSANTANVLQVNGIGCVWANGAGFQSQNTTYGQNALDANTTGNNNSAYGFNALTGVTTGNSNTGIGASALQVLTNTSENTALGVTAGQTAISNGGTYIGYSAGQFITTGTGITAIGYASNQSGGGSNSCFLGASSGVNSKGDRNVGVGSGCVTGTTGSDNISIGSSAGAGLTTGGVNIFIGYQNTGNGITTGAFNTLIGGQITGLSAGTSNNVILADGQGNKVLWFNSSNALVSDLKIDTTTGVKFGTAANNKIGFWNATPIVQPTTSVGSATISSIGAGLVIKTDDTFDGYTIAQIAKALRNIGILA